MTLNEIIKIVGGKSYKEKDISIKDIKTDSRKIKHGDLFIALKGKNYNGNNYVEDAIKKGAVACISSDISSDKCIKVDDTYESLFNIARYIRSKSNIPLIAITGSNGKTTTKDLIAHILSSRYNVLRNKENNNNLIGVSKTLFNLNDKHEIIVMELGSNHPGEISKLSLMCMPDLSVITNIGSSHLEYFKTRKNIYKEKLSIIDGMVNKKLIVNGDDKYLKKTHGYKCGLLSRCDLKAYDIFEDINKVTFKIKLDKEYKITFNNPGKHFVNDILLAIKVSIDYGIKMKTIIKKIASFKLIDKRMNLVKCGSNVIINDCYNSSYESVIAGLNYLSKLPGGRVIIIADILELGKHSNRIHKKINKKVKKINKDLVLTIGKYSKKIKGIHFKNNEDLIKYLECCPIKNSYIYVKGSRRMNLDEIVDYLKS